MFVCICTCTRVYVCVYVLVDMKADSTNVVIFVNLQIGGV
jgi:hypothetical protein